MCVSQCEVWTELQQLPCVTLITLSSAVPFLGLILCSWKGHPPHGKRDVDKGPVCSRLWNHRGRTSYPHTIYACQARSLTGLAAVTCSSLGQSLWLGDGLL